MQCTVSTGVDVHFASKIAGEIACLVLNCARLVSTIEFEPRDKLALSVCAMHDTDVRENARYGMADLR